MKKIVVANWKMNCGSPREVHAYFSHFSVPSSSYTLVIAPPATVISEVARYGESMGFFCAAQDAAAQLSGPYTGQISAHMLKQCGASYVILGHSESRLYHASNSYREKVLCARSAGLTPILCVGEPEGGDVRDIISSQLYNIEMGEGDIIAYEPVWAIGTGKTPTIEHIKLVRQFIKDKYPHTPFLYGGSVNSSNMLTLLSDMEGVLVGGFSLDPKRFSELL